LPTLYASAATAQCCCAAACSHIKVVRSASICQPRHLPQPMHRPDPSAPFCVLAPSFRPGSWSTQPAACCCGAPRSVRCHAPWLPARLCWCPRHICALTDPHDGAGCDAACAGALAQMQLSPTDTVLLASDLTFNQHITALDLSNNFIGAEGAAALARAFAPTARWPYNRSLKALDLSGAAALSCPQAPRGIVTDTMRSLRYAPSIP
jgi:hypothetical protein